MRWADLFGRTLRDVRPGGGPGVALAQRASLARWVGEECCLLPLGHRALTRLHASLGRVLPEGELVGAAPGATTEGWYGLLSAEVQSYRQLPVGLSAERWVRLELDRPLGLAKPRWTPTRQWLWAAGTPALVEEGHERWGRALSAWAREAGIDLHPTECGAYLGWAVWHADGPLDYLTCPSCGYAAERGSARFDRGQPAEAALAPLEPVMTPGADTIRALAEQLRVPARQTLKALFLSTVDRELVVIVLRGDLEVSPEKLERASGQGRLQPADEDQIRRAGAEPGFGSPVGLRTRIRPADPGLWVVGDISLPAGVNYVAGANRPDTHYTGVNYPRDFAVTTFADIAAARAGDPCAACRAPLEPKRGFWVARWEALPGFRYTDEAGKPQDGAGGLGTVLMLPLLAATLASSGPAQGPRWPAGIAPIDVYVVVLAPWEGLAAWADGLEHHGHVVLIDDRAASAGVKFADADWVGARLRVTISARSLAAGGVELDWRGEAPRVVPADAVLGLL